jgi:hypothetical protein
MNKRDLLNGLSSLDDLSRGDYRVPLADLVAKTPRTEETDKIGRLIGVSLKQPFAEPRQLDYRSPHSRSYRTWDLVPAKLTTPSASKTWQYRTLKYLSDGYPSVLSLAQDAYHERGFFRCLAQSAQKYLCADPKFRKQIEKSIKQGKASGFNVKVFTPEQLVQAGGVALGSLLIAHVPVLGYAGAPVIAGFVLLLYTIGIDAFCGWVRDFDARAEIESHDVISTPPPAATGRRKGRRSAGKPPKKKRNGP